MSKLRLPVPLSTRQRSVNNNKCRFSGIIGNFTTNILTPGKVKFFLTSNLAVLPSVASCFLHIYGEETVPFLFAIPFKDLLPTSCTSCPVSCASGVSSSISCTYTDDYCYPSVFLFSYHFSNLLTSV